MKSIAIALKDFTIRFKDRKALIMMIFMPIILTVILGSALKGVMGNSSSFPKTTVAVYQQDSSKISKQFINVLQDHKLKKSITIRKLDSQNQLNKALRSNKADVGLVIPNHWGSHMDQSQIKPFIIKSASGKELQASFIQQIAESYINTTKALTGSTHIVVSDLAAQGYSANQLRSAGTGLSAKLATVASKGQTFVIDKPVGKKQVSSIQYYAAAMAAMFLLFNAMHGGKSIIAERENITLSRMMTSPTTKGSIMIGKFLGTLFYSVIQFLIFIAATHFILEVNWGNNLLQTITIAMAYSISISGLSMIVAAFMKTEKMADSIGGTLIQVLSLIGGSMIPVSVFPHLLRKISLVAPNSWALTSFTDIMSGTDWGTLSIPICTLLGIGIVASVIGTLRLRMI